MKVSPCWLSLAVMLLPWKSNASPPLPYTARKDKEVLYGSRKVSPEQATRIKKYGWYCMRCDRQCFLHLHQYPPPPTSIATKLAPPRRRARESVSTAYLPRTISTSTPRPHHTSGAPTRPCLASLTFPGEVQSHAHCNPFINDIDIDTQVEYF